jgi:hypothetical protein
MISPKRLMSLIRDHWQIENNLHFVKDRWWDEDRHWLRRPGLAARCAALLGAALSMLRQMDVFPADFPLRARADELGANPALALKLLGANT